MDEWRWSLSRWEQNLEEAIKPLRLYAFCATGSQQLADSLVDRALGTYLESTYRIVFDNPKKNVLKFLHRNMSRANLPEEADDTAAIDEHLFGTLFELPLIERQAVLLCQTMGLSVKDAADVLGQSENDFLEIRTAGLEKLIEFGDRQAVVIEDDSLIATALSELVYGLGFFEVKIARSCDELSRLMASGRPKLICVDVALRNNENALDVLSVGVDGYSPAVVYLTAFPEVVRLHKSLPEGPLIAKPCDLNVLATTIDGLLAQQTQTG